MYIPLRWVVVGSEDLSSDIALYGESARLSDAHKAALRYVDALMWSPPDIAPEMAGAVRDVLHDRSSDGADVRVMRNASNKIAVAMAVDAPRVDQGTDR